MYCVCSTYDFVRCVKRTLIGGRNLNFCLYSTCLNLIKILSHISQTKNPYTIMYLVIFFSKKNVVLWLVHMENRQAGQQIKPAPRSKTTLALPPGSLIDNQKCYKQNLSDSCYRPFREPQYDEVLILSSLST